MKQGNEVTNHEVFLWALSQLGGIHGFVDVEHVFVKCFEVAPQRFSWRTRSDLPDYKKCAKALRDAEAKRPKLLVKTGDSFGRQFTVEGQAWLEAHKARLNTRIGGVDVVQEPRSRHRARLIAEVERSTVFQEWAASRTVVSEKWRMAELLKCSPDSQKVIWNDRLQILRAAARAAGKNDLLQFLEAVASKRSIWFRGGAE